MKWEARECATLGTNFRDIYRDGELWAMQVPSDIAESVVAEPNLWVTIHAPVPMLRNIVLQREKAYRQGS